MRTVLWWTVAGAAIPAALLLLTFVPVALATGGDSLVANVGMLFLSLVMIIPPGAIGGALVGFIDFALGQYVMQGDSAASKNARALPAALVLFVLLTGLAMVLLKFTATDMTNVGINLAFSAGFAAIPGAVVYVRYTRLASSRQAPNA